MRVDLTWRNPRSAPASRGRRGSVFQNRASGCRLYLPLPTHPKDALRLVGWRFRPEASVTNAERCYLQSRGTLQRKSRGSSVRDIPPMRSHDAKHLKPPEPVTRLLLALGVPCALRIGPHQSQMVLSFEWKYTQILDRAIPAALATVWKSECRSVLIGKQDFGETREMKLDSSSNGEHSRVLIALSS